MKYVWISCSTVEHGRDDFEDWIDVFSSKEDAAKHLKRMWLEGQHMHPDWEEPSWDVSGDFEEYSWSDDYETYKIWQEVVR